MRTRLALVVVAVAAVVSACGSSSNASNTAASTTPAVPSASVSVPAGISLDCAKFANTGQQIAQATANMFSGTVADFNTAMDALKAEFAALKDGAPDDVKAALDDMTSALSDIGKIRANPSAADQANLQSMATKLPVDGQKITAYIATKCSK